MKILAKSNTFEGQQVSAWFGIQNTTN